MHSPEGNELGNCKAPKPTHQHIQKWATPLAPRHAKAHAVRAWAHRRRDAQLFQDVCPRLHAGHRLAGPTRWFGGAHRKVAPWRWGRTPKVLPEGESPIKSGFPKIPYSFVAMKFIVSIITEVSGGDGDCCTCTVWLACEGLAVTLVAVAISVWLPSGACVVFHCTIHGAAVRFPAKPSGPTQFG